MPLGDPYQKHMFTLVPLGAGFLTEFYIPKHFLPYTIYDLKKNTLLLYKRALGPWVAHLRMTDQWSGIICEILVECIMRNNPVNLFGIWVNGSGEVIV